MFNSILDKLKELKYFKEITDFKYPSKSRGVFRTQASIYDGAFL